MRGSVHTPVFGVRDSVHTPVFGVRGSVHKPVSMARNLRSLSKLANERNLERYLRKQQFLLTHKAWDNGWVEFFLF